eukprot:8963321-Pyramimonas_sp.AAC.1
MVLARVQTRLRRPLTVEWFFWASRGRGCERAAWQQAVECEWATAKGRAADDPEAWVAVLVLLDLLKACEQ